MSLSKTIVTYAIAAVILSSSIQPLFARKLKNEIKGVYYGQVTGGIAILRGTLQEFTPVNRQSAIFVGAGSSSVLSPTNRLVPTRNRLRIRRRTATMIGRYHGTFVNPNTDQIERYSGKRRVVIRPRKRRLVMKYTDRLIEGTLSSWFLKGTLSKKRRGR